MFVKGTILGEVRKKQFDNVHQNFKHAYTVTLTQLPSDNLLFRNNATSAQNF